jgi:hypothetical protein
MSAAARRVVFDNNWLQKDDKKKPSTSRKLHKFEQMKVTRSEDLPQLMTTHEVAAFLRRHFRTVEEYRKEGLLKFFKIRGRYFSTPEYIADFLELELKRK